MATHIMTEQHAGLSWLFKLGLLTATNMAIISEYWRVRIHQRKCELPAIVLRYVQWELSDSCPTKMHKKSPRQSGLFLEPGLLVAGSMTNVINPDE